MEFDLTTLRSLITLLSFLVFGGIVYWATRKQNQARFDEAANIPFLNEGEEYPGDHRTSDARNASSKAAK